MDEAGDEGLGKIREYGRQGGASQWFGLGAMFLTAEQDAHLTKWRDEIGAIFPQRAKRDIHFQHLKHEQKIAACTHLASKPFGACVVLSNKRTIRHSGKYEIFKQPQHLYNYLVRFLLERLTVACKRHATRSGHAEASLSITFSRRTGTDYQVMAEYLRLMRDGKEVKQPLRSIDWSVFDPDDIRVENHEKRAGLQLADVVTSATFNAFEPGIYGHCETGYAEAIRSRFIKDQGCALNCGLTLTPLAMQNPMPQKQLDFALSFK
ncbi:DUF3800 domain-containing protein [Devosia sp. SD17-2]|uniref:DUF3800 domain-containing protein n=1 Tax=Devosia sp. SD17-2 TaxID=2976459 RepID=UPI0023D800A6|nr:DUF3800 domain-containing protein [Devosia sp. SD17-2]WEJ35266.1 DUF3800 domain-containing protein [Devosia sp. SD17-2]